ncbi:hypothetical protein D5F11_006800 [Siminovitchia terrae]|uniref:Uncharacterized protein n=1 Tax=Siminovitchia terrae TaxID=1914933 RepID=A0A429XAS8_SIMTE|nr:hypothetical protein [Siminovitchia terrae]RST60535.1 hypothetical protein D5F11_006800 [Siminovitchia terrae]
MAAKHYDVIFIGPGFRGITAVWKLHFIWSGGHDSLGRQSQLDIYTWLPGWEIMPAEAPFQVAGGHSSDFSCIMQGKFRPICPLKWEKPLREGGFCNGKCTRPVWNISHGRSTINGAEIINADSVIDALISFKKTLQLN